MYSSLSPYTWHFDMFHFFNGRPWGWGYQDWSLYIAVNLSWGLNPLPWMIYFPELILSGIKVLNPRSHAKYFEV